MTSEDGFWGDNGCPGLNGGGSLLGGIAAVLLVVGGIAGLVLLCIFL